MQLGTLTWTPVFDSPDLVAPGVHDAILAWENQVRGVAEQILVAAIDPEFADTQAMTDEYQIPLELSANCVIVAGRRTGDERLAAAVVRATGRADVNNVIKRHLDVRKASFLPTDRAVEESAMAYGGITPIGLPEQIRVLVDTAVRDGGLAIIGSGIRGSKLVLPGELLAAMPGVEVLSLAL